MLYFNQKEYFPRNAEEAKQQAYVLEFKENFPKEGLFWNYNGLEQFKEYVYDHLTNYLQNKYKTQSGISELLDQLHNNIHEWYKEFHGIFSEDISKEESIPSHIENYILDSKWIPKIDAILNELFILFKEDEPSPDTTDKTIKQIYEEVKDLKRSDLQSFKTKFEILPGKQFTKLALQIEFFKYFAIFNKDNWLDKMRQDYNKWKKEREKIDNAKRILNTAQVVILGNINKLKLNNQYT